MSETNLTSPCSELVGDHLGPVTCDGFDHYCNACGNWVECCPEAGTFPDLSDDEENEKSDN